MHPHLRRSGTRVSLLVLAMLTLRSLLCYLPHSTAQTNLRAASILEQEGVIGHTLMVCVAGFSPSYASGALLINRGALIHWIEDLHSKLV
jgi:hypothetical protein